MNKVMLIGRVVRDIELRQTQSGHNTCTFALAVEQRKAADGTRASDFPQIVAWNKTAELCVRYLHKGDKVHVEGSIQTRSYEKNGAKVYVTEVVASSIEFLTPRGQQSAEPAEPTPTGEATPDGFTPVDDEQLPFD